MLLRQFAEVAPVAPPPATRAPPPVSSRPPALEARPFERVRRVEWSAAVAASREPLVFRASASPAGGWPVWGWTWATVRAAVDGVVPSMPLLELQGHTVWYSNPRALLAALLPAKDTEATFEPLFDVRADTMVDRVRADRAPFSYHSSLLRDFGGGMLDEGIGGGDGQDQFPWAGGPPVESKLFVWLGANTTAHCHHDASWNTYVQVLGEKRWLLWPPSATRELKEHSALHPFARRSQLALPHNMTLHGLPAGAPAPLEVVLRPGDVLHLPPYWFHHVTALEPSLSLNLWKMSDGAGALAAAAAKGRALLESEGATVRVPAMQRLVQMVVDGLDWTGGAVDFVQGTVVKRYADAGLFESIKEWRAEKRKVSVKALCAFPLSAEQARRVEQVAGDILGGSGGLRLGMEPGARVMGLAAVLEEMAGPVLGASSVGLFFQQCFTVSKW